MEQQQATTPLPATAGEAAQEWANITIDGVEMSYRRQNGWIYRMSDWTRCHDLAQRGLIEKTSANAGNYGWHCEFYIKAAQR